MNRSGAIPPPNHPPVLGDDSIIVVSGPTNDATGIHRFEITSGDLTGFVAGQYLGPPTA